MTLSDVYHGFFHKKLYKHPFKIILEKKWLFRKMLAEVYSPTNFQIVTMAVHWNSLKDLDLFFKTRFFQWSYGVLFSRTYLNDCFKVSLTQHRAYFLPFIDHIFQSQIPQSRFIKKRCIRDICCLELYLMYECFCVWSQ